MHTIFRLVQPLFNADTPPSAPTAPTPAPTPAPVTPPAPAPAATTPPAGEQTIPYARFQEVLTQKNALEARLGKDGDVGKLQAELQTIQEKLAAADRRAMLAEVARLKGIEPALASRLKGDTQAELEADADALLAAFPAAPATPAGPTTPGVPPTTGGRAQPLDPKSMTPQQIRDNAAALLKGQA